MLQLIRQRSWFAWLGLFALAGQMVLTLGHMHAGAENGSSAHAAMLGAQLEARDHAVRAAALTGHHRETPADPDHLIGSCPYCWTIAQAASTILPTPADIRRGRLYQTLSLLPRAAALAQGNRISPFDSRGPPPTARG